jgi:hypothetical protein
MPATGPGEAPPVVVRRRRRGRRAATAAQPPSSSARQNAAFGSRPARPLPKQTAPRAVRPSAAPRTPVGDTKSDVQAGEDFKRTKPYRGAVVASYDTLSRGQKRERVRVAHARVKDGTAGPEDRAILHVHKARVRQLRKVVRAQQAFNALDVMGPTDTREKPPSLKGPTWAVGRPSVKRKDASALEELTHAAKAIGKAVTAVSAASSKGYASVNAPKVIRNAPKDIGDIVVTTPSSLAKLGSDVVHHPQRVPGELVAPYVELAKHPRRSFEDRPVSSALMLAPVARVPGRLAGRVARVAGKQTLERPAAVFPGTNLRQARTGSRDVVVRAVQSRRDRGRNPVMSEADVGRQVDAFYDAHRGTAGRMMEGAADKARREGLDAEAEAARVEGARKSARKVVRRRFAEQFGGEVHPTADAARAAAEGLPFEGTVVKLRKGEHTVVPKVAADRLRGHEAIGKGKATYAKGLRVTRRAFTRTVLPFSPSWLSGQAVESAFRATVAGAGPVSYIRGARVLRRLDPEQRAMLQPGGKSRIPQELLSEGGDRTLADEFAGTELAKVARAMTAAGRAPGVKQVRALHRASTEFVFNTLNGRIIEATAQKAMLGRILKESPLMERRVIGLSDRAIREAADGLKDTHTQVELGRELHRIYGRYSGFSPDKRERIIHWTPFLPWLQNMARFLGHTLPADHPVSTALLADVDAAEEDWRVAHGFSFHGGERRPGFLQGGYPTGPGGENTTRVGRFLPFVPGDTGTGTLVDLVLPQFSGAVAALQGRDPVSGEPVHGKFGPKASEGEKALAAAVQLIESMVPGVGVAHRVVEKGPNRVFNPLAPVVRHKPKAKARRRRAPSLLGLDGPDIGLDGGNPLLK